MRLLQTYDSSNSSKPFIRAAFSLDYHFTLLTVYLNLLISSATRFCFDRLSSHLG